MTNPTWLAPILARLNAATPGPWSLDDMYGGCNGVRASDYLVSTEHNHGSRSWSNVIATPAHGHGCEVGSDAWKNMELIAHSSADIARMARALEIACSALKAIREAAFEGDYDRCDLEAEVAEKRIEALGHGDAK
jgi:hypothetical protein